MDFRIELKDTLEADPKLARRGQKILALLNARPSRRRDRRVARMEAFARAQTGFEGDWADLDWKSLIGQLLQMFLKLLPLILAL